jgi:hypothetical protein
MNCDFFGDHLGVVLKESGEVLLTSEEFDEVMVLFGCM